MKALPILEMQYEFQRKLLEQKVNQIFSSYDIERFLNEAQTKIVEELADNFETDEKVRTYLYPLITVSEISPSSSISPFHPNGVVCTLPSDYYRALKEEAIPMISGKSASYRVKIKPQKHDYYNSNIDNVFKKPYSSLFWRLDTGLTTLSGSDERKLHEIITDGSAISKYILTYLKMPTEMSISNLISCKLHAGVHYIIVDTAVVLALQSIEKDRLVKGEIQRTEPVKK